MGHRPILELLKSGTSSKLTKTVKLVFRSESLIKPRSMINRMFVEIPARNLNTITSGWLEILFKSARRSWHWVFTTGQNGQFWSSRRGLVVKALDSHARGCGFKSCLAQDKDYWWGKVTGAHLHKCAHSPGHCPLWLGNRLRSKSSMPHKKRSIAVLLILNIVIKISSSSVNKNCCGCECC